jgi:hypothetical protein
VLEDAQHIGAISRNAGHMLFQDRIDRRLRRSVRPLSIDAGHPGK